MNKGKLVCLMGIDGSGKTTIARLFKERLQEMNRIKVEYVWCKFGYYSPLLRKLFCFIGIIGKPDKLRGLNSISGNNFKNKIVYNLYLYFLLMTHYLTILNVRISLSLGKTVICDRYLPDTLVDLVLEFNQTYEDANKLLKKLYFTPKPDLLFILDFHQKSLMKEKRELPGLFK